MNWGALRRTSKRTMSMKEEYDKIQNNKKTRNIFKMHCFKILYLKVSDRENSLKTEILRKNLLLTIMNGILKKKQILCVSTPKNISYF